MVGGGKLLLNTEVLIKVSHVRCCELSAAIGVVLEQETV